jgi:GNAT superfamily N-acetyltransferase
VGVIQDIAPNNRSILSGMFANHKRQRVVINAAFYFSFGKAFADSETVPEVAMLRMGTITLLGGDPTHPAVPELFKDLSQALIIPETQAWSDSIRKALGKRAEEIDRWGFSLTGLDMTHLRTLSEQTVEGYEIQAIHEDENLAREIGKVSGATAYGTFEEFAMHCVGFCTVSEEKANGIALSYTNSRHGIEVQISIGKAHRRKGLGTALGASLIGYCLDLGIAPHWNAANEISAELAKKLGYLQNDFYHPFKLSS